MREERRCEDHTAREGREKDKDQRSEEGLDYFSCNPSESEITTGQPWSCRNVPMATVPPSFPLFFSFLPLPSLCLLGGPAQHECHIPRCRRGSTPFLLELFHRDSVSFLCNPPLKI